MPTSFSQYGQIGNRQSRFQESTDEMEAERIAKEARRKADEKQQRQEYQMRQNAVKQQQAQVASQQAMMANNRPPQAPNGMQSLEAAMLMQDANSIKPQGYRAGMQVSNQQRMRKKAMGLEETAQNEQRMREVKEAQLAKQAAMDERIASVNTLGQGFGMDMQQPDNVQKMAALSQLIESKADDKIIEAYLLRSGLVEPEPEKKVDRKMFTDVNGRKRWTDDQSFVAGNRLEKDAPVSKPSVRTVTAIADNGDKVSRRIDNVTGDVVSEDVIQPADYVTPAEKKKQKASFAAVNKTIRVMSDYRDALKDTGYEADMPFNRTKAGKLNGKYKNVFNEIRKSWEMGAMQEADLKLMEASLGDPNTWTDMGGGAERDIAFLEEQIRSFETDLKTMDPDEWEYQQSLRRARGR